MAFDLFNGFNGDNGSLLPKTQVNVRGYDGIYLVLKSFPVVVSENNFVNFYVLNSLDNNSNGLICPEQFLSKVDNVVESSPNGLSFDIGLRTLNGSFGSFKDGYFVKFKFDDRIYKVKSSFFMLNSANAFIICYKLLSVSGDCELYCPHSFLIRVFEPDCISGNDNGGSGGDSSGGNSGNPPVPQPLDPPHDGGGGSDDGIIVT